MVIAGNNNACCVTDEMDYTVRAFLYAKTASDTFSGVDFGYALVVYTDGISWADLYTVAVSKTSERAEIVAGIIEICRLTGLRTVVIVFSFFRKAEAVTGNVSDTLYDVKSSDAHNRSDFRSGSVSSGNAEVCFVGFSLRERLCVCITA